MPRFLALLFFVFSSSNLLAETYPASLSYTLTANNSQVFTGSTPSQPCIAFVATLTDLTQNITNRYISTTANGNNYKCNYQQYRQSDGVIFGNYNVDIITSRTCQAPAIYNATTQLCTITCVAPEVFNSSTNLCYNPATCQRPSGSSAGTRFYAVTTGTSI